MLSSDHALLERAKSQWLSGDWDNLCRIKPDDIQDHPYRAHIVLLAAIAHQYRGNSATARRLAELAREWGCSREHLARVLISNVYETLGRARVRTNDPHRAKVHFNTASWLMTPEAHSESITRARLIEHTDAQDVAVGLRINKLKMPRSVNPEKGEDSNHYLGNPRFDANAYHFYQKLAEARHLVPFLLLDSKSLPRAGIHYLKHTLARLLPGQFSFCEWYQEPGCCRKTPCALKAYAEASRRSNQFRVRMIKSHDFLLDDPVFPALPNVQRVILIRNPLFVLTSWFELEQLRRYEDVLNSEGISMKKIWLLHEPEVVAEAINVLDRVYEPIEGAALKSWLSTKSLYIARFMEKWVYTNRDTAKSGSFIVRYEDIGSFASFVAKNQRALNSIDWNKCTRPTEEKASASFNPRHDPFTLRSELVSSFVNQHRSLFLAAASFIMEDKRYESVTTAVCDS